VLRPGSQRDDGRLLVRHPRGARAPLAIRPRRPGATSMLQVRFTDSGAGASKSYSRRATCSSRWRTRTRRGTRSRRRPTSGSSSTGIRDFGQIWFAERRRDGIPTPAFDYDAYFTMDGTSVRRRVAAPPAASSGGRSFRQSRQSSSRGSYRGRLRLYDGDELALVRRC